MTTRSSTTTRLDLQVLKDNAPSHGRVRINHDGCPAGIDRKKRLEIKRCNDGSILGYCHHCGSAGYVRNGISRIRPVVPKASPPVDSGTSSLPADLEVDPVRWPPEAKAWFVKYGILPEVASSFGIGYSPRLRRVVLPCYDSGVCTGYQARKIFNDDSGPKYYTKRLTTPTAGNNSARTRLLFDGTRGASSTCGGTSEHTLVITEDALSAIKCGNWARSIALLNSSIDSSTILEYVNRVGRIDRIIIFLDNDNAYVKKNQLMIKRSLSLVFPNTDIKIIWGDKDPKEYNASDLQELLK